MTLAEYGATEDAPHLQKRRRITYGVGERTITAGWIGPCPERQCRGFATERNPEAHKIHALDAYAISTEVLERLGGFGVGRVFVIETDTGDIREYPFRFWKEATDVPERFLASANDPQRYVKTGDEAAVWEGHRTHFYLPRDADL